MVQEIINKLKAKKQQLQNSVGSNSNIEEEKPTFEIILSEEKNFYRMEISDYISIVDYTERMSLIDNFGLESLIGTAVLWNSGEQKVNKGLYYVVPIDNRLYNILIEGKHIRIDERIKTNNITEERFIFLDVETNHYSYTFHKHDHTGNTFYTRYFRRDFSYGNLDLSVEDFTESVTSLIHNLEIIDNIRDIVDIKLLKESLFGDLENKMLQKKDVNS